MLIIKRTRQIKMAWIVHNRKQVQVSKPCKQCDQTIERRKNGILLNVKSWNKKDFCSETCRRAHCDQSKICQECGQTFSRRKPSGTLYSVGHWEKRIICSLRCRSSRNSKIFSIPAIERFWKKVNVGDENQCWDWVGGVCYLKPERSQCYGAFRIGPKTVTKAHRFSYMVAFGKIDEDALVRHKCDRPICVNPMHLEKGSHQDNADDKMRRGRHVTRRRDSGHWCAKVTSKELSLIMAEIKSIKSNDTMSRTEKRKKIESIAAFNDLKYSTLITYFTRQKKCRNS